MLIIHFKNLCTCVYRNIKGCKLLKMPPDSIINGVTSETFLGRHAPRTAYSVDMTCFAPGTCKEAKAYSYIARAGSHNLHKLNDLNTEKTPAQWWLEPQATCSLGMCHGSHTLTGIWWISRLVCGSCDTCLELHIPAIMWIHPYIVCMPVCFAHYESTYLSQPWISNVNRFGCTPLFKSLDPPLSF